MQDHRSAVLGVGISCAPGLCGLVREVRDLVDLYEVSPDLLCQETVTHGQLDLAPDESLVGEIEDALRDAPVVYHGLTLSIGSAAGWNHAYLAMLDGFFARRAPAWHSEHLGFLYFDTAGGEPTSTGIPLPMPFTVEAATLVAERIASLQERYPVPFLGRAVAFGQRRARDAPSDPWAVEVMIRDAPGMATGDRAPRRTGRLSRRAGARARYERGQR